MKTNIAILLLLIFFTSCKKNQVYNIENLPENIHSLLYDSTAEYDGVFTFEESRSIASQESEATILQLSGGYKNYDGSVQLPTSAKFFVNNYEVLPLDDWYNHHFDSTQCSTIVGRDFDLSSIDEGDTNSFANFNTTVYFPPAIHMYFPEYIPMGIDSLQMIQGSSIQTNQSITWNADPNNKLGVVIILEYDKNREANTLLKRNGDSTSTANYVVVPDNGSYSLTSELLDDIPNGGVVELTIMRGNIIPYTLPKDSSKKIKIVLATKETGVFQFNTSGN